MNYFRVEIFVGRNKMAILNDLFNFFKKLHSKLKLRIIFTHTNFYSHTRTGKVATKDENNIGDSFMIFIAILSKGVSFCLVSSVSVICIRSTYNSK